MQNIKRIIFMMAALYFTGTLSGCRKYLEIDQPKDQITSEAVFDNATNTLAAVNGLYTYALKPSNFLTYQGDFLMGVNADEFTYGLDTYDGFMNNSIPPANNDLLNIWTIFYQVIYQANSIIEKVPGSPVSDSLKAVYISEAKIFRAFCHLYLTCYFGDVPLIKTTNVTITSTMPRTPKATVLEAITTDLKEAEAVLPVGSVRNGRFNKWMATALLARVYLYQQDWANAEAKASVLISLSDFSLLPDLNKVFLRGSKEAIWQVNTAGGANDNYTYFAGINVPTANTALIRITQIRPELYNAFETGDARKTAWIGTGTISGTTFNYDYKYKATSTPTSSAAIEDFMLLRLAEQYLIRAEARAQQDNLQGAIDDINVIRARAGLTGTSATTKDDVLLAVEQERRVELFGEGYGHRWIDLVRTGRIDAVMTAEKPNTWKNTSVLLPIPATELANNPALKPNPSNY
ncbi:Starch-binding associating with outer membrane [Chitinophaga sp. CF118]|uniref:RagB/SusD family nutrient uptake outer membrane protein n=1 Tax=Chitinophaga sp. CF118 TaxID=1884367 RepID=UPI0008EE7C7F|nr:RagB/SusD family nutrient uptake outer membrane protein [Chitinophaga sp. CF118]SFF10054.1 Starch-binding associating with outer membrane [Chitinophaga sp. CF118]